MQTLLDDFEKQLCKATRPKHEFDTCELDAGHEDEIPYHEDAAGHRWPVTAKDEYDV